MSCLRGEQFINNNRTVNQRYRFLRFSTVFSLSINILAVRLSPYTLFVLNSAVWFGLTLVDLKLVRFSNLEFSALINFCFLLDCAYLFLAVLFLQVTFRKDLNIKIVGSFILCGGQYCFSDFVFSPNSLLARQRHTHFTISLL